MGLLFNFLEFLTWSLMHFYRPDGATCVLIFIFLGAVIHFIRTASEPAKRHPQLMSSKRRTHETRPIHLSSRSCIHTVQCMFVLQNGATCREWEMQSILGRGSGCRARHEEKLSSRAGKDHLFLDLDQRSLHLRSRSLLKDQRSLVMI